MTVISSLFKDIQANVDYIASATLDYKKVGQLKDTFATFASFDREDQN